MVQRAWRGKQGPRVVTVYRGTASSFRDRKLMNDVLYRYSLRAVDRAGNRSSVVVADATPRAILLVSPRDGALLRRPPLFVWVPVPGVLYFNLQLHRAGVKILTVWPSRARYRLRWLWTYQGRRYGLTPGKYTWFVWPGVGPRSQGSFGKLLGQSTFVVPP